MTRWALTCCLVLVACGSGGGNGGDAGDTTEVDDAVDTPDTEVPTDTAPEGECTSDEECDDSDPCTADICLTDEASCEHEPVDADGDGFAAASVGTTTCDGTDCDDGDENVFPDSDLRVCDADADCNGQDDHDNDGDGHDRIDCGGDDCEDEHGTVFPGAIPECGTDETDPLSDLDCNGNTDADNDGDGHTSEACGGADCDDTTPDISPSATEICADWIDEDCDGLVDDPSMRISNAWVYDGSLPSAVWLGSDMGAAWNETDDDVHYYRFPLSGISGGRSRGVSTAGVSRYPSLAFTGSTVGVVWADDRDVPGTPEVYYTLMDPDGTKLTGEVRVTDAGSNPTMPTIEWTGSEFGLLWQDGRHGNTEVYFARLATDGSVLGTELRVTDDVEQSRFPDLEWTGSEFAAAWADMRDGNLEIYFQRISSLGAAEGSAIRITSDVETSDSPSLAWTGSEFGLSWTDMRDGEAEVYFVRLTATGTKIGTDVRVTDAAGEAGWPFLLWESGIFALAWEDQRDANWEIYFVRLEADGTESSPQLRVSNTTYRSRMAVMAWTGSELGVFWTDGDGSDLDVLAGYVQFCE